MRLRRRLITAFHSKTMRVLARSQSMSGSVPKREWRKLLLKGWEPKVACLTRQITMKFLQSQFVIFQGRKVLSPRKVLLMNCCCKIPDLSLKSWTAINLLRASIIVLINRRNLQKLEMRIGNIPIALAKRNNLARLIKLKERSWTTIKIKQVTKNITQEFLLNLNLSLKKLLNSGLKTSICWWTTFNSARKWKESRRRDKLNLHFYRKRTKDWRKKKIFWRSKSKGWRKWKTKTKRLSKTLKVW